MAEFQHLGEYLKESRKVSEITQSELAQRLGDVHTQFVSNWERGICCPPNHCFQKLIDVLHLDRAKLVEVMLSDSKKVIKSKFISTPKK